MFNRQLTHSSFRVLDNASARQLYAAILSSAFIQVHIKGITNGMHGMHVQDVHRKNTPEVSH